MRIVGLSGLVLLALPVTARAAIVINEIAWMGTTASANAEWIELRNTGAAPADLTNWRLVAASGAPSITLAGTIAAQGYFLLERTGDGSVPEVAADQIYTGALTNSGTTLTLSDPSGISVDEVAGGANWSNIGGNNASKETAQRTDAGWTTAAATPRAANAGAVGSPAGTQEAAPDDSATTTQTVSQTKTASEGGRPVEYIPIPTLRILTSGNRTVSSGASVAFTAVIYDGKGNRRDDALVTWAFGDGTRKTGASVFHEYYSPGEYLAVVRASTVDGGDAFKEMTVSVKDANIRIASASARGIELANSDTRTLDLSLWRLSSGGYEFKIPEDTQILPGRTIIIPARVHGLPLSESALLLYPSGEPAATYPATASVKQPEEASNGSLSVQEARFADPLRQSESEAKAQPKRVEPITSISNAKRPAHDNAIAAPAATTRLAAAGAAFEEAPAVRNNEPPPANMLTNLLRSPWTLSLLGVIGLAGGAFIFL